MLTGDDYVSKIGTKKSAFSKQPELYLSAFAEGPTLTNENFAQAEEFLVRVLSAPSQSVCRVKTFNGLRLEKYKQSKHAQPLETFPPTSSAIRGHIKRAFYVIRTVVTILDDSSEKLNPTFYGWEIDNFERLLPAKHLKLLPSDMLTICKCRGRCATRQCPCRKAGVACMLFCHNKESNAECCNKIVA